MNQYISSGIKRTSSMSLWKVAFQNPTISGSPVCCDISWLNFAETSYCPARVCHARKMVSKWLASAFDIDHIKFFCIPTKPKSQSVVSAQIRGTWHWSWWSNSEIAIPCSSRIPLGNESISSKSEDGKHSNSENSESQNLEIQNNQQIPWSPETNVFMECSYREHFQNTLQPLHCEINFSAKSVFTSSAVKRARFDRNKTV